MNPHPDAGRLTAYLVGRLSWPELKEVETHLEGCAPCRSQVAALEGSADSFLHCLRGLSARPDDDSELARLVAGVHVFAQSTAGVEATEPGQVVAGHELRKELARGGLGVVYLAYHPILRDFR